MTFYFYIIALLFSTTSSAEKSLEKKDMVQWVKIGDQHIEQGHLQLALDSYEKAKTAGAGSAPFLNRLSALYMETQQYTKAIDNFRASLSEEPGQLHLYSRIGEAQLALGQLDSAIASVEYAKSLVPENSAVHSAFALLLIQSGDVSRAKAHLDSALYFNSSNPEAHRLLGFYFTKIDSIDAAINHYQILSNLLPNDVEGLNNIAFLHANRKDYLAALKYYKQAKERVTDPYVSLAIQDNMEAVRAIIEGKMRARYILVKTRTSARDIVVRLEAGEDFATLARNFSVAPNADHGGDLGFFGSGELVPVFEEAVVNLAVGSLSDIIQISKGFVIIQRLN